ncbi:MAG: hypothetical protein A2W19_16690 [Spirochaetes bacterium RBG_16_49_21]|nr:MAG: hypothetical protein A2W19_16690 [Spirochaetes bacterium RBG_16_49_21]
MHHFRTNTIFDFLASQSKPVMEIELLRFITGRRRMPQNRERLFALHFSLYHALYRLKLEAGRSGYYLNLDPLRIRLIQLPGPGSCHYYFADSGSFCGMAANGGGRCPFHVEDADSLGKPSFDPLYEFYTNEENRTFGKSDILDKLMKGAVIYALKKGEIQKALDFFGLSRPNLKTIKKRYWELAKLHHPDLHEGDDAMMKELNYSYRILLEVFVI